MVSSEVQKEGERLKMKSAAQQNREGGRRRALPCSSHACRRSPFPWHFAPRPKKSAVSPPLGPAGGCWLRDGRAWAPRPGLAWPAPPPPGKATANRFWAFHVAFFHCADIIICRALGPSLSPSPFHSEAASQAPALKGPRCFA